SRTPLAQSRVPASLRSDGVRLHPECRSASFRDECSASPESPDDQDDGIKPHGKALRFAAPSVGLNYLIPRSPEANCKQMWSGSLPYMSHLFVRVVRY